MILIILGSQRVETEIEVDLEKAEFFRTLSVGQLAWVLPQLHEKQFVRQRILYFERSLADRLWIVRRGVVRLYKSSNVGRVTTLDVLGPGEIFGAVSAIETDGYPSGAEAVSDGSAWWLRREAFLELLKEEPRLGMEILTIVSRRLRDAHDRLRSFAHDPAPARLAWALLRAVSDGEAHVTRRALAEVAGTTVETAIRVLRRFEHNGIIRGEVGCVHVLDEDALFKIAGGTSS